MTEVAEMVAVAFTAPHTKEDCPFCKPKEEVNTKNFLRANYDGDTEADNDTDNSSGTLAKNLKNRPQSPKGEVPEIEKGEKSPIFDMDMSRAKGRAWHQWTYDAGLIPILYGAHHLIPGNAALGKCNLYKKKYLGPVDNGADKKNIGYNVNSANNGIWLPGNYAVRPWKGREPEFQKAYAFLAMHDTKRQFHDAHEKYSEQVLGALNELEKLMKKMKNKGCPMCKEGGKAGDPPYHLNARLNAISRWLRGHLKSKPKKWKANITTSSWCSDYKTFIGTKSEAKVSAELEVMRN